MKRLAIFLAGVVVAAGCSKSDSDTDKLSFSESPEFTIQLPKFIQNDEVYTIRIAGGERATTDTSSKTIGYYISDSYRDGYDTVRYEGGTTIRDYVARVPSRDTLGTFNVYGYCYADGYYPSYCVSESSIVNPSLDGKGTLTGFNTEIGGTFTDARDGEVYYYIENDGIKWMRQNLGWKGSGYPYQNCPVMDRIYGRFYTRTEALTACPEGWELPDSLTFAQLLAKGSNVGDLLEDIKFNGEVMWEYWPAVKITNELGLSLMPTGWGVKTTVGMDFFELNTRSVNWLSDSTERGGMSVGIYEDRNWPIYSEHDSTSFCAPVRCIKR